MGAYLWVQVAGMDAHTFKAKLNDLLSSCDKDGNGTGAAPPCAVLLSCSARYSILPTLSLFCMQLM